MQAENTRLIIHTGARPGATEDAGKQAGHRQARASRVRAGEVVVWGFDPEAEAARRPAKGNAKRRGTLKKIIVSKSDAARRAKARGARPFIRRPLASQGVAARESDARICDASRPEKQDSSLDISSAGAASSAAHGRAASKTRNARAHRAARNRRRSAKARLTFGERLLRNSAIACALLLALLAARNIDTPWTRAAVEGVERALTMKIDLDSSLGSLSFVRDLMPESMLVFFDLSAEAELLCPVEGTLEKRFSEERPWVEFACAPEDAVVAAKAGDVVATTQLSGGGWGVMIEHDNGLESVCAYLLEPEVSAGERVERGQVIARSEAGRVYFEARRAGELIDPAPLLGL